MAQDGTLVGEAARLAGVAIDTVRYYERMGLIPEPARRSSGYRAYGPDVPRRLRFIKRAQEFGFSLREVRELLELRVGEGASCADVREAALRKACAGRGPTSDCPILDAMDHDPSPAALTRGSKRRRRAH